MNLKKIKTIVIKEIKELLRDPIGAMAGFLVPLCVMLVFGFGMKLDVKKVHFGVVDYDHTPSSRRLIYKLASEPRYFVFDGEYPSVKDIDKGLLSGKLRFGLVIPKGFERKLKKGQDSPVQILIDSTFPYRGEITKSYVVAEISQMNLSRLKKLGLKLPLKLKTRYWFNEELKQDYLMASGTLAVVLFMSPAIISSLLIAKEKERGSIYNIYSSSISKFEFLLGKQVFTFLVSLINFFFLFFLTLYLFKVPFKGSFFVFFVGSAIFIMVSAAFGLLISTFLNSQVSAFVGAIILTILPSVLYSGYLTPVSAMKKSGVFVAHIIPTYYYMKILKGVYFKGVGFSFLYPYMLVLLGFYMLFFALNVKLFKKRES